LKNIYKSTTERYQHTQVPKGGVAQIWVAAGGQYIAGTAEPVDCHDCIC